MTIAPEKKNVLRSIINAFETGSVNTNYSTIYIYKDGPGGRRQLTLGFGITEYGNLKKLVSLYIAKGGKYSRELSLFVDSIGRKPLVDDVGFKTILVTAAKEDQIMRDSEDEIYDGIYWARAFSWAHRSGMVTELAMAVILDSFIHSGSILDFLRTRFPEKLPADGGDEKRWIVQYIAARKSWLANHSNKILRNTTYRMKFFEDQVARGNWRMDCPLTAHGIKIC